MSNQNEWVKNIEECVSDEDAWMARKFIGNLSEHKRRYPLFKVERVAEMFIKAEPKYRAWMCYQAINKFTKSIHKSRSFDSLCQNKHL